MILFPSCKINLGLCITARRPDGYHDLQTAFYPVGWADALEVLPAERFHFSSSGLTIPGEGNLCIRAYELLRSDYNLPPVQMHLHKIVPIGAGLGGGSADAAYTLRALNELFALRIADEQLETYARQLGADCAFFVQNRPRYATGKGDEFSEIRLNLSGYYALLVYPNVAISTAEAYAGVTPRAPEEPLATSLARPVSEWPRYVVNDFEQSLFPRYPLLAELKHQLYNLGAVYASLSGSGSTVFGLFADSVTTDRPKTANQFGAYRVWEGVLS